MKSFSKILVLLLAVAIALVGCSAPTSSTSSASSSDPVAAAGESDAAPVIADPSATALEKTSDGYPNGPITLLVPFAAGGSIDIMCRTFDPFLRAYLGTDFLVENKAGAGSQIALDYLQNNAEADDYTISEISEPHASFTIAVQGATYKPEDFEWLCMTQIDPGAMIVMNEKEWNTMPELIQYIKDNPGEVAIGCTQMSGPHVLMLYMQNEWGLDFTIVPYTGGGEGRAALLGDHIDAYFGFVMANYNMVDIAKCIGIGAPEKSALWPDASTFAELMPEESEFNELADVMAAYRGFVLKKGFKEQYPERYELLKEAFEKVYNDPEYVASCEATGQKEILKWFTAEEAAQISKNTLELVAPYASYFAS